MKLKMQETELHTFGDYQVTRGHLLRWGLEVRRYRCREEQKDQEREKKEDTFGDKEYFAERSGISSDLLIIVGRGNRILRENAIERKTEREDLTWRRGEEGSGDDRRLANGRSA